MGFGNETGASQSPGKHGVRETGSGLEWWGIVGVVGGIIGNYVGNHVGLSVSS